MKEISLSVEIDMKHTREPQQVVVAKYERKGER